jgi:hypothetical protein
MADRIPAPRPVSASIILLRSHGFARKAVADQARVKGQLEALVAIAVAPLPAGRWLVLDAPEGLAIVVLSGAEAALDTARRALAAAADLPLAIGVNHGPIVAEGGERGDAVVAGDGIETAMIVAGFAAPGKLLVSRTVRDEVAEHAPERAEDLSSAGTFTDGRVRTHELFAPDDHAAGRRRRRMLALGALGFSGIIALGFAARAARQRRLQGGGRATIEFEITPRGEVYIDGESKGRSPPLMSIEIAPGAHVIEVRNGQNAPLRVRVNLQRGESMAIRHSFAAPEAGGSGPIKDLKRKLGM